MTATPNSGGAAARPGRRPAREQIVLEVLRTERLSQHLIRIIAGGSGFDAYLEADNDSTDTYAKMLFADRTLGLVPPYDLESLREELPIEQLPSVRTYTIRSVDPVAREIAVDFVVHGDVGVAGPWAERSQPGDPLVLLGVGGGYAPDPAADWHFLAGDEAALPAIASALEAMASDAIGVAVIEVYGPEDEFELTAPDGVEVRWVHRDGEAGSGTWLNDAVREVPWRDGDVQVFAHGEREAMKGLRDYFFTQRSLNRTQVSLSGYWAYGRTEDKFQAEKREPIGQILPPG